MGRHSMKKKIAFLTGTRADFGKLKSLIEILHNNEQFEVHIFATGMHMDQKYGYTVREIEKRGYENIYKYINHDNGCSMDITLSRTIEGFANYVRLISPDLIVVHGDRIEALAGSTVGALNNILVAHIEGGEVSGTVDELIRHAVSKLSHLHFVANEEAKKRLIQMGERAENVYIIGSPDMDVMMSNQLASWSEVAAAYEIPFDKYSISMFHPVTTEVEEMDKYAAEYVAALEETGLNYIVIYPNNDKGSDFILHKLKRLQSNPKFRLFPSVRFEAFLVMMKRAQFIIGNSSAGIREAPFYGIPTVNVGTRQNGRTRNQQIIHTGYTKLDILQGVQKAMETQIVPEALFGDGNSDVLFLDIMQSAQLWKTSKQKLFADQSILVSETYD
jgi:UDP-N-acetylglucosamine 2-epimerase (hydrolysing)